MTKIHLIEANPTIEMEDKINYIIELDSSVMGIVAHNQLVFTIESNYLSSTYEGVKNFKIRLPYVGNRAVIEEIYAQLDDAPTSAALRINVLKNGVTILNTTAYVEIPIGETTVSRKTDFAADGAVDRDDYFQIEIVQGDPSASYLVLHVRYKWRHTGV